MDRGAVRAAATAVCLALAAGLALAACAPMPPRAEPPPLAEPETGAIRMAAVGDSITDGDSLDLAGGVPGPLSWVSYAIGPGIEFVGGWAEWGATTERMAAAVRQPLDADVLVILAGTNDVGWIPHEQIGRHLTQVADAAAVDSVVLSSVPPNDYALGRTAELNEYLARLAAHEDWIWVDAAAGLRDGDRYAEGMSSDGVHPSEEGARVIGAAIGAAILDAVGG